MSPLGRVRTWVAALHRRSREVYGINRRNVELVYVHNPRTHYPVADDKLLAKSILAAAGVPVPANLASCEGLFDIPRVLETLAERQDFVLKPANGGGGEGILVVGARSGTGAWLSAGGRPLDLVDIRTHLANIVFGAFSRGALSDRAMVEPRIVPHPVYQGLWAGALCDVRVLTLSGRPLMAMVRVPTHLSGGRANLHQGGLGLGVDLATGRVDRALYGRRAVTHHPDSGAALVGIELPLWDETLDIARRAAAAVPLGYLGVDIVVDVERGPLVLEINARPGLEIQNVNHRGLGETLGGSP